MNTLLRKMLDEITNCNKILDLGSGGKYKKVLLPFKSKLESKDYVTYDIDEGKNPDIVGDAHDIKLESDSFDAVLCINLLEHCENPNKVSEEIKRVLKQGGHCLATVPCYHPYHANLYEDYYRFTSDGCHALFKDFTHVAVFPSAGVFTVIGTFLRLKWLRFLWELLDWLFPSKNVTPGYYIYAIK